MLEARSEFEVVGEAGTGSDALRIISDVAPDVAVVDFRLPGLRSTRAIRKIQRCAPGVRVLVLTEHGRTEDVVAAINAGASGYALKGDDNDEILHAFQRLRAGRLYLAPSLDLHRQMSIRSGQAIASQEAG